MKRSQVKAIKARKYTINDVKNKYPKHDFCANCSHTFDKNGMCPCRKDRLKRLNSWKSGK